MSLPWMREHATLTSQRESIIFAIDLEAARISSLTERAPKARRLSTFDLFTDEIENCLNARHLRHTAPREERQHPPEKQRRGRRIRALESQTKIRTGRPLQSLRKVITVLRESAIATRDKSAARGAPESRRTRAPSR